MQAYIVATFYQFADFPDYQDWRRPLLALCQQHGLKGTLLLASEGINSTIAGSRAGIDALLAYLRQDLRFASLSAIDAPSDTLPFKRLKIKLKKEIVTMGVSSVAPAKITGTHVDPDAWNALLQDENVLVLDTRNDFEVQMGSFQRAVNPGIAHFRDFPAYVKQHLDTAKHQKVAMFCTGGIRCEKASAFMLQQGFNEVYQLKGGILKYLATTPSEESRWQGECFVFDERVKTQ